MLDKSRYKRAGRLKSVMSFAVVWCLVIQVQAVTALAQYVDDPVEPIRVENPIKIEMLFHLVGIEDPENAAELFLGGSLGYNFGSYFALEMEMASEEATGHPDKEDRFLVAFGPKFYALDMGVSPFLNLKANVLFGGEHIEFSMSPTLGLEYILHDGFGLSGVFYVFEGGLNYVPSDGSVTSHLKLGGGLRF